MQLTLLIEALEKLPPDAVVKNGFTSPHSYRGYYEHLAFSPASSARIGDMLAHAKSALNRVFSGYKGGEFMMCGWTECWIAPWGDTVDYPIHPLEIAAWEKEANSVSASHGTKPAIDRQETT